MASTTVVVIAAVAAIIIILLLVGMWFLFQKLKVATKPQAPHGVVAPLPIVSPIAPVASPVFTAEPNTVVAPSNRTNAVIIPVRTVQKIGDKTVVATKPVKIIGTGDATPEEIQREINRQRMLAIQTATKLAMTRK